MKDKSIDKKKASPSPIILIQDTQQLSNTIMISKMINNKQNSSIKPSSNVFGGGFKYRPEENQSKVDNSKLLANVSKLDKHTVYDEFGLINDSIGKKKYREENKQAEKYSQVGQVRVISSNNPWKKESRPSNEPKAENSGYYEISKIKERQQTAIHVKSSLQVINLDNIQAKLQAHRSFMKPIEQQYNHLKGKSNIFQQPKQKMRFKDNIDREYKDVQPSQVYQMIKNTQDKMDRPKEEVTFQQMWDERKKNDPKIAQYEFKYQQFRVDKQAKKMIGSVVKQNLFSWDKYAKKEVLQKRKQAQKRKSKQKNYGDIIQNKSIQKNNRSISPQKANHIENISIRSIQEVLATKDDKFIGKYIMAQIDIDKRGMISKEQLYDYIQSKKHIINGYHIDIKWLHTDLDNFQTKRKGMLSKQQIIQFLATLDSLHHPQIVLKQVNSKNKQQQESILFENNDKSRPYTSYYRQNMHIFEKVFQMLDFNDDKIIKREQFIENIFIDADCNKIIDNNVLVLNVISKNITFRQIISLILDDYRRQRNQKLKKSKEYITLQNFHKYFQVPESLDLNLIDKISTQKSRKSNKSTQIQMFDIQQEYLLILKDIFDTIPRIYQNYIVVNDFISISLQDPQILAISDQLCRIQSFETNLPVQTIASVLRRMRQQCDQYGIWEIVKTYFSRRGRPLDWHFDLIQKKRELREQKIKDIGSKIKKTAPKGEQLSQSRQIFQLSYKINSDKQKPSVEKYTIPQPFNITDQKKKPEKGKKIILQQKKIEIKTFKATPLNSQILSPKPCLIQGRLQKSIEKNTFYNYQNYQNDRIERTLKKAQEKLEEQQRLKQIKELSQFQAKQIKINLKKKLQDVVKQQKKQKEKTKPKPTIPQAKPNLYPQNLQQEAAKKIDKFKSKLQKQKQAAAARENLKLQIQQKAKERNKKVKVTAEQKKKKQQQQKQAYAKLEGNSFKPTINKTNTTQQQKQSLRKAKQQRQQKKLDEQLKIIRTIQQKKKERLSHVKILNQTQLNALEDEKINGKTLKQIKQIFNGLAGRERLAMQIEEKRLLEERRQAKEKKQAKIVKDKLQQGKELKEEVTTTMNVDTNFHRSNALRRYRAMMEGKQPPSEYDKYSQIGQDEI